LLESLFNEQALRVSLSTDEDFDLSAARVVVRERDVSGTLAKSVSSWVIRQVSDG
jgi:hypothetical protein